MSVVRPRPREDPIDYVPGGHLAGAGLEAIAGRLDSGRAGATDAPFVAQPDRLLADYGTNRATSELFSILQAARRIREAVDRVIVIGGDATTAGVRALFAALCHPFHNELPRSERGGRPRLSFTGGGFDNDRAQGLLDLVAPAGRPRSDDLLDRWAILVACHGDEARATAATTRLFLAALEESVGGDRRRLAERLVPIAGGASGLADLARAVGCREVCGIPDGVEPSCTVFTAVGLLPAAIVGIDVVQLLGGAAAMNRRFREAPAADNPVLLHAAAMHLTRGARTLASGTRMLDALGAWCAEMLAGRPAGVAGVEMSTAVAAVPDTGATHLVVVEPRRDRLAVPSLGSLGRNEDAVDDLVGTAWPELPARVAIAAPAAVQPRRPVAEIRLPRIDEHAMGQTLQMLMLAGNVAGRLPAPEAGGEPSDGHAAAIVPWRSSP